MILPYKIKGWLTGYISPEQALADFLKSGNQDKLRYVIDHYNQSVFHYLLSFTNKDLAEDVLQNTWLKVFQSYNQKQPKKPVKHVKAWLFTIARNSLIDELRKDRQWQDLAEENIAAQQPSLLEKISQQARLEKFNDILERLPFLQREAFIFRQEGFSLQEISELTGSEIETVKSRLRYAKKQFKAALGDQE